ncbi:hypothetical protein [Streptococcus equi]
MKHYLAIDIGGTAIKYGLMTETGDLLEKHERLLRLIRAVLLF